jgi:hypothetical protein
LSSSYVLSRCWTKEEVDFILDNWDKMTKRELAVKADRSLSTIYRVWEVTGGNKVDREEAHKKFKEYLENNYMSYITKEEKEKLAKQSASSPYERLTPEQIEEFKKLWPSLTAKDLGKKFGLSKRQVYHLCKKLDLPKKIPNRTTDYTPFKENRIKKLQQLFSDLVAVGKQNLSILEVGKKYAFVEEADRVGWQALERVGRVIGDYDRFYLVKMDKGYMETMHKQALYCGNVLFREVDETYKPVNRFGMVRVGAS